MSANLKERAFQGYNKEKKNSCFSCQTRVKRSVYCCFIYINLVKKLKLGMNKGHGTFKRLMSLIETITLVIHFIHSI